MKEYIGDNVILKLQAWEEKYKLCGQITTMSVIGAHHHNSVTEHTIGTISVSIGNFFTCDYITPQTIRFNDLDF